MNNYDEKDKIEVFEGTNGQILMIWSRIEITRKGKNANLFGTKIIFLRHLTAIQFKNADEKSEGYIQFIFPGSQEDKDGFNSAKNDENTIFFNLEQQENFEHLRDVIIARHDF